MFMWRRLRMTPAHRPPVIMVRRGKKQRTLAEHLRPGRRKRYNGWNPGVSRGRGGSMHLFSTEKRLMGGYAVVGGQLPLATGAGLAIVRKGLERMGGKVGLESAPKRGSKFWIELPKTKQKI